jgi:hypothetical protein
MNEDQVQIEEGGRVKVRRTYREEELKNTPTAVSVNDQVEVDDICGGMIQSSVGQTEKEWR